VLQYRGTTGAFLNTFVASGSGGLSLPNDLVFGPDGNLYVPSQFSDTVLRYNGTTGALIDVVVTARSGGLTQPLVARFGPDGNLYVSSYATNQVLRYHGPSGGHPGAFLDAYVPAGGGGLSNPTGMTFGPDGYLYVSSRGTNSVLRTKQAVAGAASTVTLTAKDSFGNVAAGYRGTVHASSSDPRAVLPADSPFAAADAGMHTFSATLKTAGTQSLTATDTANGALTGSQGSIQVNAASASRFVLSAPASVRA